MDSIDNYQVSNLLGKGGFASVYRAKCISTGQDVAIKMVDKKQMAAAGMSGRVRQEVAIHSRLKHPSILNLITFLEDENYVYLVLELCENGELARFLKQNNTVFSEQDARTVFTQVVSGTLYLHSHGIMHRDLTLANLMLTRDMDVKIGDFGLATVVSRGGERHMTMCGTPNFISPEVATRSSHGLEADVWGLGCLLYTVLVGRPPFDTAGVRSTLTKVVMADFSLPDSLSSDVKDLIKALLKKNPAERMKLQEIMEHPWLRWEREETSRQGLDSGMYTMTTTGFSNSSGRVGPKPVLAYPLTSLPESMEVQGPPMSRPQPVFHRPEPVLSRSEPVLGGSMRPNLHPCSPPVKMRSDPQDLPAPLLPAPPVPLLRSKLSSLPSLPTLRSTNQMETNRSHHSIISSQGISRQISMPESNNGYRPTVMDDHGYRPNSIDDHGYQPNSMDDHGYRPNSMDDHGYRPSSVDNHDYRPNSMDVDARSLRSNASDPVQRHFSQEHQQRSLYEMTSIHSQYNPPVKEQYNPPGPVQYNPPVQEQYNPPGQEQYNPPGPVQYNPPGQEQYSSADPGQYTNRLRNNSPVNQKNFLPEKQLSAQPHLSNQNLQSSQQPHLSNQNLQSSQQPHLSNQNLQSSQQPNHVPHSVSQPYSASKTSQPYSVPQTSQPYSVPSSSQPYSVPTSSQPYSVPTSSQPYSVPSSQPYSVPSSQPNPVPYRSEPNTVQPLFSATPNPVQTQPAQYNTTTGQVHQLNSRPDQNQQNPVQKEQSIEDVVAPINSVRLRPTRQKTKNAVANILPNGEVCLEFIKNRGGEEKVMDVLRISTDGLRIAVYHPGGNKNQGVPVTDAPPPIPTNGADAFYSYSTLPNKLWKKYLYASRFVNLVKAKTPKMTLYTDKAKSYLMENSPESDFETYFYSGAKITKTGADIKLIELDGKSQAFRHPINVSDHNVPPGCSLTLEHFNSCYQHCLRIQNILSQTEDQSQPTFPVIIGRKPVSSVGSANSSLEKENKVPPVPMSSFRGTILSTRGKTPPRFDDRRYESERGAGPATADELVRKVNIPEIGTATQLANGNVRVDYSDGSALVVKSNSTDVDYFLPGGLGGQGAWTRYNHANLPQNLKQKLAQMPQVIERLLAGNGRSNARPASIR